MSDLIKKQLYKINQLQYVPVCVFLLVSLTTIFLLYVTNIVKSVPCGKDILSNFYSNFVHIEIVHLLSNVTGLYVLSRVEYNIGAKSFIKLLSFIIIFNTITETIMHKLLPNTSCSIGFSGVLFGIATWELITTKDIDYAAVLAIIFAAIAPSQDRKSVTSISAHIIGAVSGIIAGIIYSQYDEF